MGKNVAENIEALLGVKSDEPEGSAAAYANGDAGNASMINLLTQHSQTFLFSYSLRQRCLVAWSDNCQQVLGVNEVTIARDANLFLRHVHPDDRFLIMSELEQSLSHKKPYRVTYRWIRPDLNQVRWLHCRASVLSRPEGEVFEGMILDLSPEFTGAINKLAGPDAVATVLAAFPTLVFTLDRDLRVLRVNRSNLRSGFNFGDPFFKSEQFILGSSFLECFANESRRAHYESIMLSMLEGKLQHHRDRIYTEHGVYNFELAPLIETGAVEGLLCIVSDISEVVRIEKQLADLQKTEGLRLLAAGIAHNFNNALQSIVGQAASINNHPDKPELAKESSQAILDIVSRSSKLIRQLSISDEKTNETPSAVDLNLAAMTAVNRIEDIFSSGIKINVAFGNPPAVMARHDELVDAIEAVVRNAREAMSEHGIVSIKTYQMNLDDYEVENLKAGSYARLVISDSGNGMDAETIRRCLDPFFTTKSPDPHSGVNLEARGLGLSKALSIVRGLGGTISVESLSGRGTAVSLYLPVGAQEQYSNAGKGIVLANNAEILVIDDDLMVLKTIQALLKDMGFACLVAEDYRKALNLIKSAGSKLKLVLLDAVMPGMDGVTLLRRIKKLRRDLKIIGFSGAPPELTKPMLDAGAQRILSKPVDPQLMREAISEILGTLKSDA